MRPTAKTRRTLRALGLMPPKNVEPREWKELSTPLVAGVRAANAMRAMHTEHRCGFWFGFTPTDFMFPVVGDLVRGPGFYWPAPYDGDA